MVATGTPRPEGRAALDLLLLHLERLQADVADMKTDVRRMRRTLDVETGRRAVWSPAPVPGQPAGQGSLRQRRAALGLSQAQVGREAGVSRSQVQALETGTRGGTWGTLAAYLAALERLERLEGMEAS